MVEIGQNKKLFQWVVVVVLLFSVPLQAKIGLELEPIVGYERVQKIIPTPHTRDRLVYGALLTAGLPLISVEAEYLRGQDEESFPTQSLTTKDTTDRAKLGLRSRLRLSGFLSFIARAGVEARRNIRELTTGGSTVRTEEPIKYSPYAGAGLRAQLSRMLSLTAGMTVLFVDWPRLGNNEYQTTLGLTIQLGSSERRGGRR